MIMMIEEMDFKGDGRSKKNVFPPSSKIYLFRYDFLFNSFKTVLNR